MTERLPAWLRTGSGQSPVRRWALATDAPLVTVDLARETGETLAADASGALCLIDRMGQVVALTRGFHPVRSLHWADTGISGVALIGETRVCRFDRKLKIQQTIDLSDAVTAVALAPHGRHLAVSVATGRTIVFDEEGVESAAFETIRPLGFLEFITTEPAIVGAADHGLLCWHEIGGAELWSEKLWSNVGDMSLTGNGGEIYLAGFTHGVQIFDRDGDSLGSLVIEGTPNHVSTSFAPHRLAVTTIERHFYWLDADGEMVWTAELPDEAVRVLCDPAGRGVLLALRSGHLERLDWK